MADYLFDQGWTSEKRRLDALGRMYDPFTIEHLRTAGVAPGHYCLEIGAGSGTIARWLLEEVGDTGHVTATDIDPRFLKLMDGGRIEVRRHDIVSDPLDVGRYDVIHLRAVLQHVRDREQVVAKLARALRPDGVLVIEDIIMPHPACYPALPAWGRVLDAMTQGLQSVGADPFVGLQVKSMMERVGLQQIQCAPRVPMMYSASPSIEFVSLSVEQVGPRLVAAGAIQQNELDEVLQAFASPGYVMTAAVMIATTGHARS